jgi:hypothetical protein
MPVEHAAGMMKFFLLPMFVLSVLSLPCDAAAQAVPTFVKRPEFVNAVSKRTEDVASYLKKWAKKEVTLVTDESSARVTIELLSVTKNVTGVKNVNHLASAIAGTVITESGDSYTAVARVCIPAKNHCEELSANATYDWEAAQTAASRVKRFVKDNAPALR